MTRFTESQFKAFCDPEHVDGWQYGAVAVFTWVDEKCHIRSKVYKYHQYKLAMRMLAKHPNGDLRVFKGTKYCNSATQW